MISLAFSEAILPLVFVVSPFSQGTTCYPHHPLRKVTPGHPPFFQTCQGRFSCSLKRHSSFTPHPTVGDFTFQPSNHPISWTQPEARAVNSGCEFGVPWPFHWKKKTPPLFQYIIPKIPLMVVDVVVYGRLVGASGKPHLPKWRLSCCN